MKIRIDCAICNKPVDTMRTCRDVCTMELQIDVRCHGETQRMKICELDPLAAPILAGDVVGLAFASDPARIGVKS